MLSSSFFSLSGMIFVRSGTLFALSGMIFSRSGSIASLSTPSPFLSVILLEASLVKTSQDQPNLTPPRFVVDNTFLLKKSYFYTFIDFYNPGKSFLTMTEPSSKPPADFSYLDTYGNRTVHKLPTMWDKYNFHKGFKMQARITNMYDLSKFWFVMKPRELELFQKALQKYYYMDLDMDAYRIPAENVVPDLYCVAFTDQNFYRCVVTNVVMLQSSEEAHAQVHYIDYGMFGVVELKNLYYWCEKICKVPQFAVRGAIAGICPTSDTRKWTPEDVLKFSQLVCDQMLWGFVQNVYEEQQRVDVLLAVEKDGKNVMLHKYFVEDGCAEYIHDLLQREKKARLMFLYPSHGTLESGKVPTTVSDLDYQSIMSIEAYFRQLNLCKK